MNITLKKEFYPSLCYHGLKKLGFTGDKPEKDYLQKSKELSDMGEDFSFSAPVAGGPLFTFIYQIPGYIGPEDIGDYEEIMEVVKGFIFDRDITGFLERWPGKTRFWDEWYTDCLKNHIFEDIDGEEEKVIGVIEKFQGFMIDIWEDYLGLFDEKFQNYPFEELQINIDNLEVAEIWNEEFGWDYNYDKLDIVVCPESKTAASSLGPEKIVFSSRYPWGAMKNSVIHEVGVRFFDLYELCMDERTREYMKDDYVGILRLIETEVCYRKKKIMPNIKDDPFIKGMQLEALIEWRSGKEFKQDMVASLAEFYREIKEKRILKR